MPSGFKLCLPRFFYFPPHPPTPFPYNSWHLLLYSLRMEDPGESFSRKGLWRKMGRANNFRTSQFNIFKYFYKICHHYYNLIYFLKQILKA